MSLVVSKHIELQTGVSIRKFNTEMKKVTYARMINQITNKELRIRSQISIDIKQILQKLNLPH